MNVVGQFRPSDPDAAARARLQCSLGSHGHAVQFYQDDESLREVAGQFLADGLRSGQPVVAVVTPDHRGMFEADLRARGFDVDTLAITGELGLYDARDVMSQFMIGEDPHPALFREVVGRLLTRLGGRHRVIRAYGEMVDVLWKDGNPTAAVRLEELWNALSADYHFTLLCGYAIDNFMSAEHGAAFERICGQHHHVVPAHQLHQPLRAAP